MFYVADSGYDGNLNRVFGVKDTSDGVLEYYTSESLNHIIKNGIKILSCNQLYEVIKFFRMYFDICCNKPLSFVNSVNAKLQTNQVTGDFVGLNMQYQMIKGYGFDIELSKLLGTDNFCSCIYNAYQTLSSSKGQGGVVIPFAQKIEREWGIPSHMLINNFID